MINYDDVSKENINKHYLNWLRIPDHPQRIFTTGGSRSRKKNALLTPKKQQGNDDYSIIDKTDLYFKDSNEAKYQYLI